MSTLDALFDTTVSKLRWEIEKKVLRIRNSPFAFGAEISELQRLRDQLRECVVARRKGPDSKAAALERTAIDVGRLADPVSTMGAIDGWIR